MIQNHLADVSAYFQNIKQPGLNEDASASKNCRQQAVYVGVTK